MIREAEAVDLGALAAILGGRCQNTDWMPKLHSRKEDLWFVGQFRTRGVLGATGRPAMGLLARRGFEVGTVYIASAGQRNGLGRAFIAEAMDPQDHLQVWAFAANLQARAFYTSLGFKETGRTDGRDNEERLPDVRLEWRRHGAAS